MSMVLGLFGVLALMLVIGVPIAHSLGIASFCTMVFGNGVSISTLAQKIFGGINSTTLLSIPFFILAGNIMSEGGISRRIVEFCNTLVGHIRGGMAIALILACAFFAALSGSAPATVVAVGMVMYEDMVRLGYREDRVAGLLAVSGGLGPIIPPSIIMVVYATLTGASIGKMFAAGAAIGVLLVVALVIMVVILGQKEKWPKSKQKLSAKDFLRSLIHAIPALLLPIIILGGIYSGLMTAVEVSAVAVVYGFAVSVFIYKELNMSHLMKIVMESAKSSAMILFIVATSTAFTWIFTYSGISKIVVAALTSLDISPVLFLLVVAVVVLIFGTFLEGTSICILLVPVLWPVVQAMGISAIQFGMVMCVGIVIGTMTPPVAVNIFSACSVSKLPLGKVVKGQMPFFVTFIIIYLITVVVPGLYMWIV